jgi:ABC-2 type transport system permease protein
MFSIFRKEFRSFLSNATGYVVISIFLLLNGLFLWVIPGEFNILDSGYANLDGLFYLSPWLFLFLCPALTMRLLAEEKQSGTWELLATKPLSKWAIILGKYMAGWMLVIVALLPVLLYYFIVSYLAEPVGNIDSGAFWGSFTGLILLAAVYVAIGIFSSSLSNNQLVSFVTAVVISFFMLYGFELIGSFFNSGKLIYILENCGIQSHYKSISRGVIDSRDLIYFLIVIYIFLFFTEKKMTKN